VVEAAAGSGFRAIWLWHTGCGGKTTRLFPCPASKNWVCAASSALPACSCLLVAIRAHGGRPRRVMRVECHLKNRVLPGRTGRICWLELKNHGPYGLCIAHAPGESKTPDGTEPLATKNTTAENEPYDDACKYGTKIGVTVFECKPRRYMPVGCRVYWGSEGEQIWSDSMPNTPSSLVVLYNKQHNK